MRGEELGVLPALADREHRPEGGVLVESYQNLVTDGLCVRDVLHQEKTGDLGRLAGREM